MHVGFTGTRDGMTDEQKRKLRELLIELKATRFHHGDCIGADEQAHAIAKEIGLHVVSHPPTNESKRAFCAADEERAPKEYLARNRDIVDESEVLIAAPKTNAESKWSGTWATIRYSRRKKKRRYVLQR